ncbi:hypothetical protein [Streptomyces sp. NPDC007100]
MNEESESEDRTSGEASSRSADEEKERLDAELRAKVREANRQSTERPR